MNRASSSLQFVTPFKHLERYTQTFTYIFYSFEAASGNFSNYKSSFGVFRGDEIYATYVPWKLDQT